MSNNYWSHGPCPNSGIFGQINTNCQINVIQHLYTLSHSLLQIVKQYWDFIIRSGENAVRLQWLLGTAGTFKGAEK